MKTSIPWSIKGIEPEARKAAKIAARRSGMTLGQWLNSVILDTNDEDDNAGLADYSDRVPHRNAGRQEAVRYGEDIQDRLDDLTYQISNLTRRQSETAVSRVVEPKLDLEPVTEAVRELIGRVERNERRSMETLETFDKRLQQMSDKLVYDFEQRDKEPDAPENENFQAFELALKNIVDHIEQTDKRNSESIVTINARLGELSLATQSNAAIAGAEKAKEIGRLERQLAEMAARIERAEHRKPDTSAFTAIEARVSDLSNELHRREGERAESRETDASALSQIESRVLDLSNELRRRDDNLDNFASRDDLQLIQARIQDIVSRLDETNSGVTDATIASMQQEIALLSKSLADQKLDSATSAEVHGLKHTIDAVAAQLRDIAEFSVDPDVAVQRIEEEITSLSQSVADLSIESASNRELTELRDRFEQIAEEVQIQQTLLGQVDPKVIHQTRAELSTLNEMMAKVRNDSASIGDMQKLRDTVTQMSAQISQISRSAPDAAAHQALERRLNELGRRLDQDSSNSVPRKEMGALDQRIRELEGQLQAQLEIANAAAADEQANALLQRQISDLSDRIQLAEAAALQPMPASDEIPSAAVGAITALEQGLQSVQDNAHKADKRTQETLEAVHETLEKVVTRLARLEDAPPIAPAAYTAPLADAALPPVTDYSESHFEQQSTSDEIDDLQLPPIVGLDDQPSGLSIGEPPMEMAETPAYAYDEPEEGLPDLRLDPVDLQQDFAVEQSEDFSTEHAEEFSAEQPEALPAETPQIQADDFIAAARRAAQSSPEADKVEEEPAPSRFNILRGRAKSTAKKEADAKNGKNKKKTVLLAAAIALLAIGTLSTINLVTGNRTSTVERQTSKALTAPVPAPHKAGEPNLTELSNSNEKPNDAMTVPRAREIDRPINPQTMSAKTSSAPSDASQVYQRILEARKKRRANANVDIQPSDKVPLAIPLGDTLSDQIVTGSIQSRSDTAGQNPAAGNRAVNVSDSLLTKERVVSKPEKSELDAVLSNASNKSSRGPGFISVSDSLPPAEIGPMSLRVAAATGNPNAQFEVAARYAEGKIITQDFRKAALWYQKAAAKGLAPAQYRLGTLYEKGRGVPADKAAARIWYERAAEKGNSKAMHNLAVIYADTAGGEPNFAKAALWFRNAAELGLTDSQYNYGILNERGLGVRPNAAEAYKWFSISAQNGDKGSKSRLPLLEKKMSPEVLIRAKLDAENWEPRDPVREANRVAAPSGGWGSVNTRSTHSGNTRKSIASAQGMLNDMGYLAGPADGVLGPRTRDAIRKFQRDSGLPATGMVTRELLHKLIQQPG